MARVPVPSKEGIVEALRILEDLDKRGALKESHGIRTRLELLINIFSFVEPDTADALIRQLRVVEQFEHPRESG